MPLSANPDEGFVDDDAIRQAKLAAMQRALAAQGVDTPPNSTDLGVTAAQAGQLLTPGATGRSMPGESTYNPSPLQGTNAPTNYPGEPTQNPTTTTVSGISAYGTPGGYSGPRAESSSPLTSGSIGQPSSSAVSAPASGPIGTAPITAKPTPSQPSVTSPGSTSAAPTGAVTPVVEPASAGSGNIGQGSAGTGSPGAGVGSIGAVTNQIGALMQSLTAPGTPVDAQAAFLARAKDVLSMLDQQEASLRGDYEKQGTTLDPATQFAINKLRDTLSENIKTVQEQLNARGLYSSGIELELENRLQKGSASDQAQLIAQHLGKLQDQLNTGLTQIRQGRTQTLSQFGLAAANAQSDSDENTRRLAYDREQAALRSMLDLRGQYATSENAAAQRQFEGQQGDLNRANAINLANLNNAAALARAAASARGGAGGGTGGGTGGTGSGFGPNITGYPPVTGQKNPYGGVTPTPGVNSALTNAAVDAVGKASTRTSALQSLYEHSADMSAAGVDLQAVMDAIDKRFPPAVGPNGLPLDETNHPSHGVGGSI